MGTCRCGRVDRHTKRGYQKGWVFTQVFDHVSVEAKDLIKSLLEVQPLLRPTAAQCLAHPWFQKSLPASDSGPVMGGGIASTILSLRLILGNSLSGMKVRSDSSTLPVACEKSA